MRLPTCWQYVYDNYIPPPPLMQIERVEEVKLLGVLLTPTLSMQSHVKYTISILNQRLYRLNQLRRQGPNVSGLTQVFMTLVVARFQYALPALAGQLSDDDLHKVEAVFSKARRRQLTTYTPNAADLIEQCDKHLLRAALNPTHCLHSVLPPKKNLYGRNLRKKGHGRELPLATTKLYNDSILQHCIYKYV